MGRRGLERKSTVRAKRDAAQRPHNRLREARPAARPEGPTSLRLQEIPRRITSTLARTCQKKNNTKAPGPGHLALFCRQRAQMAAVAPNDAVVLKKVVSTRSSSFLDEQDAGPRALYTYLMNHPHPFRLATVIALVGVLIVMLLVIVLMTLGLGMWGLGVGFAFAGMLVNWSLLAAIWREVGRARRVIMRAPTPRAEPHT